MSDSVAIFIIILCLAILAAIAGYFLWQKYKTAAMTVTTGNSSGQVVVATYDYASALDASLFFYSCQKCGHVTGNNRTNFRFDCHLNDYVVGGFHDAGDTIKVTQTIAFTVVMLAWGYLEFKSAFTGSDSTNLLDVVFWGTNYIMGCYTSNTNVVGLQGDPAVAHALWDNPEAETSPRAQFVYNGTAPASDLLGYMSASLSVASLLPVSSSPTSKYTSSQMLGAAQSLFVLGAKQEGCFSNNIVAVSSIYPSTRFADKLALAAGWLYRATSATSYLTACRGYLARCDTYVGFNWDNCAPAAYGCLCGMAGGDASSLAYLKTFTTSWMSGGGTTGITYTPLGLAVLGSYGVLRNACNAAFLALLYSKYSGSSTGTVWAQKQVDYVLGKSGRSLVVGLGSNPPQFVHHMSGSCPIYPASCGWSNYSATTPNPNVVLGALVGGSTTDTFTDIRSSYQENEPSTEYNACFTGCLAALVTLT